MNERGAVKFFIFTLGLTESLLKSRECEFVYSFHLIDNVFKHNGRNEEPR